MLLFSILVKLIFICDAIFQLSPIERYAVALMEAQMEDEVAEELKMAEVSVNFKVLALRTNII